MNIFLDVETVDPFLESKGPGTFRKDNKLLGIAIKKENDIPYYLQFSNYFDEFDNEEITVVGHNILYDLEILKGIKKFTFKNVNFRDTMIKEFVINDNRYSYSLENCLKYYNLKGKLTSSIQKEFERIYPGTKEKAIKNMDKLPIGIISKYTKNDVVQTQELYDIQEKEINHRNLSSIYELECDLIPYYLDVRFHGLNVDRSKAEQLYEKLNTEYKELEKELWCEANYSFDIWSNDQIIKAAKNIWLNTPISNGYTPTGRPKKPAINAEWFRYNEHISWWNKLHRVRELNRLANVFIKDKVLELLTSENRLHYQLIPTKGEFGGTVSSRLSSRNPNMQQVPKREGEYAKEIRSLFIPENGCKWVSIDESQTEPRMAVHYATLLNCRYTLGVLERYKKDSNTDFYQYMHEFSNKELSRSVCKTIHLARTYGAGIDKIAGTLGKSREEAEKIISFFDDLFPFVKDLMYKASKAVERKGYIKTLLGGISYPNESYKALNRLIQRSCAEVHKKCLLNLYKEGYLCILPVHDEMNFSFHKGSVETDVKRVNEIILESVKLEVPRKLDTVIGDHW